MPRYQDTGRCIGYAHLLITDEAAYNRALSRDRQMIGSRYLDIKAAQGAQGGAPPKASADDMPADCKTLFVKNLPYDMQEDDIGDRFRAFGEIASIRIAYNWQTK